MKQAQSQNEPLHPMWWVNDGSPKAMNSPLFKKLSSEARIRACTLKLETIADQIGFTNELDAFLLENASLSSGSLLRKVIYQTAAQFADSSMTSYRADHTQGLVSIPFMPVVIPDQAGLSEGLNVFQEMVHQENALIQLLAVPENMDYAKELFQEGKSLHFTDVLIEDQIENSVQGYMAGLSARIAEKQDIEKIHLFLSVPVNSEEIDTLSEYDFEKGPATELPYLQKLYLCLHGLNQSDEMQAILAAGGNLPEMIWTEILPADGAIADTYYVEMLGGAANFEADLHLVARCAAAKIDSGKSSLQQASTEIQADHSPERIESFYERRKKQVEHDLIRASRMIRDKSARLQQDKLRFAIHNQQKVDIVETLEKIKETDLISRIWQHDFTAWKPEATEISNRLGWLHCAERMLQNVKYLERFVAEIILENKFKHVVLCGMGGSSLAPEVFQQTFGVKPGYLELFVLDSTDPWALNHIDDSIDIENTMFIISTKSGSTIETVSMMKYFYHRLVAKVGVEQAGTHFIAITDPGSSLIEVAKQHHFRKTFLNDPNIGGRYSALSFFGLVPAALIGIDVYALLEKARGMQVHLSQFAGDGQHMGMLLGAILGKGALMGRDKLTFILSPGIQSFGIWVEQLIAESTGKEGKGILPVVGEKVLTPRFYQNDRLFVYLHISGDHTHESEVQNLIKAGFPMIDMECESIMELGSQFLLWEYATALAGSLMEIQPFDQPNVELAKISARKMVAEYKQSGSLSTRQPIFQQQDISVFGECPGNSLSELLTEFLSAIQGNKYCSIQAYLPPSEDVEIALADIQTRIHANKLCAVTVGIGPRYLHSTGQLHKGDAGNGVFIQITSDAVIDLMIPDDMDAPGAGISFGILKLAAALGDQEVLREANRPVLHIHLGKDVYSGLKQIALSLAQKE